MVFREPNWDTVLSLDSLKEFNKLKLIISKLYLQMIVSISLLRLSSCQINIYFNFLKLRVKKSALCNLDKNWYRRRPNFPPLKFLWYLSIHVIYSRALFSTFFYSYLDGQYFWRVYCECGKEELHFQRRNKLTSALRCSSLLKCRNNIWSSTSTNCWTALAALQTTALSDGVFNTSRRHSVHI